MNLPTLFTDVVQAVTEIYHGWTSPEKACALASMVVALRPSISVEIGVYAGKGLISMGLAHKAIGYGKIIGIDPYTAQAAVEGERDRVQADFWASKVDYKAIMGICVGQIAKLELSQFAELVVASSNDWSPPEGIGLCRVDGNHGQQAFKDIKKFAPKVRVGGFIVVDDEGWASGGPRAGVQWLCQHGFEHRYPLEDGPVLQRVR